MRLITTFKKMGFCDSWAFRMPDTRLWLATAALFVVFFALGEIIFRMDFVRQKLTGPRIGSSHRQFEEQIARLEKLTWQGEQIDCIFLGNSMTWLAINPLTVNEVFRDATGQEIHCFNFGVSALTASSAGWVASALATRYQPKVLIYGTFARDFNLPAEMEDASMVTDTPWLRHVNGDTNWPGWLYDNSFVFRYRTHVPDLLFFDYKNVIAGYSRFGPYHEYGFDPKMDVRIDVQLNPDFTDDINQNWRTWLSDYTIQAENIEGLKRIIALEERGVEVILVEMPIYATGFDFFTNPEHPYVSYVDEVRRIAIESGVPFWQINHQPQIPKEDWWDHFHVNYAGAQVFSTWMGRELSKAALQGALPQGFSPGN